MVLKKEVIGIIKINFIVFKISILSLRNTLLINYLIIIFIYIKIFFKKEP